MIQNLIQALITLLQNNLLGVSIKQTPSHAVPSADQLFVLAHYLTELPVNQSFRERPADQSPRFLPATQLVALSQERGPSRLDHTLLPETLLVQTGSNSRDAPQSLARDADVTLDKSSPNIDALRKIAWPFSFIVASLGTGETGGEFSRVVETIDVLRRKPALSSWFLEFAPLSLLGLGLEGRSESGIRPQSPLNPISAFHN